MRWRRKKKPHVHSPIVGTERIHTSVEVTATSTCECGEKIVARMEPSPNELLFKEVPK